MLYYGAGDAVFVGGLGGVGRGGGSEEGGEDGGLLISGTMCEFEVITSWFWERGKHNVERILSWGRW